MPLSIKTDAAFVRWPMTLNKLFNQLFGQSQRPLRRQISRQVLLQRHSITEVIDARIFYLTFFSVLSPLLFNFNRLYGYFVCYLLYQDIFLILQSLQYLQRITAFKILLQTSAKPESSSIYLTLQAMCYIATTATGNTHVICIKKNVHKWQKMRKKKRQPLNLAKSPSQAMELTGKNLRPIMETQTLGPISNSLSKNQNHLFLPNFLSFGKDIYIYTPLSPQQTQCTED